MKFLQAIRGTAATVKGEAQQLRERKTRLEAELNRLQQAPLPIEDARRRLADLIVQCQATALRTLGADLVRCANFGQDASRIVNGPLCVVVAANPDGIREIAERQIAELYAIDAPYLPEAEREAAIERVAAELAEVEGMQRAMVAAVREQLADIASAT